MANLNGDNYALGLASPKAKIENGAVFGKIHNLRESYTISAALADGDLILGPLLPKGAVVMDAKLHIDATLGTGGILTLGHLVGDGAVEAEDLDAFVPAVDGGGQAALGRMAASSIGLYKQFSEAVRVVADCTEASSVTSGVTISFDISYIIN
jgi:hypothetical protein